jgi:hypothetical protein
MAVLFLTGIEPVVQGRACSRDRETGLQTLWNLIAYALVASCCLPQTVPEGRAAEDGPSIESSRRIDKTGTVGRNAPTKITMVGNRVLVPTTFVYRGAAIEVQLLLDTGASETVINAETADRLSVDVRTVRRAQVRVVGGAVST